MICSFLNDHELLRASIVPNRNDESSANGELRELRIARANMALSGYADIPHQRKTQRMNLQGQCKPA